MAHIISFSIDGLAGRRGTMSFELNRDVNVFWGLNGTGKTSLLKILHAALRNDAEAVARLPFDRATVDFYSVNNNAVVRRTFRRDRPTSSEVDEFNLIIEESPDWGDAEDAVSRYQRILEGGNPSWVTEILKGHVPHSSVPFRHGYLPISRVAESRGPGTNTVGSRRDALNDAMFDAMFAKQVTRRWQNYNAKASARIREVQQQGIAEILSVLFGGVEDMPPSSERRTVIDPDSAYILVTDFLRQQRLRVNFSKRSFRDRYANRPELGEIVAQIADVMAEVREAVEPQIKFMNLIGDLYSGGKNLELRSSGLSVSIEDSEIPLESLSSGEKQLMQILLEVMDGESDSVIIDEPELSMHVDWQNRLVESMLTVNPDAQLILATHSPEVMAHLDERMVFEL